MGASLVHSWIENHKVKLSVTEIDRPDLSHFSGAFNGAPHHIVFHSGLGLVWRYPSCPTSAAIISVVREDDPCTWIVRWAQPNKLGKEKVASSDSYCRQRIHTYVRAGIHGHTAS